MCTKDGKYNQLSCKKRKYQDHGIKNVAIDFEVLSRYVDTPFQWKE